MNYTNANEQVEIIYYIQKGFVIFCQKIVRNIVQVSVILIDLLQQNSRSYNNSIHST